MIAILDATGIRNKLWPLTEKHPSANLNIGNEPIIGYLFRLLLRFDFKDVIILVDSTSEKIKELNIWSTTQWVVNLKFINVNLKYGTGGFLEQISDQLNETFIYLYGDSLIDIDLGRFIESHKTQKHIASVALVQKQNSLTPQFIDGPDFHRYTTIGNYKDTGAYIFEPSVLEFIPSEKYIDIQHHLMPEINKITGAVNLYVMKGLWNQLTTFSDYLELQKIYLDSVENEPEKIQKNNGLMYPEINLRKIAKGVWVGRNVLIHPTVKISPPIIIGTGCFVDRECQVGPYTIIGENCRIENHTTISESIIFDNSFITTAKISLRTKSLNNYIIAEDLIINIQNGIYQRLEGPPVKNVSFEKFLKNLLKR